jgi:hypothetical protein
MINNPRWHFVRIYSDARDMIPHTDQLIGYASTWKLKSQFPIYCFIAIHEPFVKISTCDNYCDGDLSLRVSCKNDTRIVRCNYSDIYSGGRFDDTAAIHFCETANYEIRSEISSGSSRSYRTWYKESTFHNDTIPILRLITLSWYYHMLIVFQSLKKEIERRIEVIPRIQYEPQLISDPRYILTSGSQAPPHYYRLKAVDDVKTLGRLHYRIITSGTILIRIHLQKQRSRSMIVAWRDILRKIWERTCSLHLPLHWMEVANVWFISFVICMSMQGTILLSLVTRSIKCILACF